MINDPEWASKEEWDTYAWFGFAIQEAQSLERILLVIAVALNMRKGISCSRKDHRASLYNEFGFLNLRNILDRVRRVDANFLDDFASDLEEAINIRNDLAHAFFWPKDLGNNERTEQVAQAKLMAAASLFRNLSDRLEVIIYRLLDNLGVDRSVAEGQAAMLLRADYPPHERS
jgi:hypothetical protein